LSRSDHDENSVRLFRRALGHHETARPKGSGVAGRFVRVESLLSRTTSLGVPPTLVPHHDPHFLNWTVRVSMVDVTQVAVIGS
jgi:hypothetical protein